MKIIILIIKKVYARIILNFFIFQEIRKPLINLLESHYDFEIDYYKHRLRKNKKKVKKKKNKKEIFNIEEY